MRPCWLWLITAGAFAFESLNLDTAFAFASLNFVSFCIAILKKSGID